MAERYSVKKWEKDQLRSIRDKYRALNRQAGKESD